MSRVRAGRYPKIREDCSVREVVMIVRDRTGRTPIRLDWCDAHLCWIRVCEVCGRDYHTMRAHTKYCSTACSQYAYRQRVKANERN